MLKRTPLYDQHCQSSAKIVDFFGWEMPLHYGSQVKEHHAVRQDAGVFDISHMTVVDLLGAGGRQLLRNILANDVDRLIHPGQAQYTLLLNHQGGVIDDLIVYFCTPDKYRLVLNAATRDKDLAWLQRQSIGLSVGIQERPEYAMLAVQGPNAISKTMSILPPACMDAASTIQTFEAADIDDWFIAKTGYTGEQGFEIILPAEQVTTVWKMLIDAGVQACGLGARDTLRLEAGMLLYGQDLDEQTSPLESGLQWVIAMDDTDRDFIGRGALELLKQQGIKRKLVGLVLEDKGVLRHGQKVMVDDLGEGVITSGSYSPTLACSIALARVPKETMDHCDVEIRGKRCRARVVKPRFVKEGLSLL